MIGFQARISGIGSYSSTNWAQTTAQAHFKLHKDTAFIEYDFRLILEDSFSGQSYKHFTLVNYDSRVLPDWKIPHITTLEL